MDPENTNDENGMANIAEMLKSIMGGNFSLPTRNSEGGKENEEESYCGDEESSDGDGANATIEIFGSCEANRTTENGTNFLTIMASEEFTIPPLTYGVKLLTDAAACVGPNDDTQEDEQETFFHPWLSFSLETASNLLQTSIRVVPQVLAAQTKKAEVVVFVDNFHPTDSYTFMAWEAVAHAKFVVTQNLEIVNNNAIPANIEPDL